MKSSNRLSLKSKFLVIGILTVVAFAAYANSIPNLFVWDDVSSVEYNEFIRSFRNFPKIFTTDLHHFGRGSGNFYRPLVALSFMVDYGIYGLKPYGYHVTNVLLHLLVAILLFAVLRKVTENLFVPFLACVLFLLHPVHTQAVSYVSGRADMLAAVFMLASLLLFQVEGTNHKLGNVFRIVFSLVFYVCALLSKETALIFPMLFFIFSVYFFWEKSMRRKRLWDLAGILLLTVIYGILRGTVLDFTSGSGAEGSHFLERFFGVGIKLLTYIRIMLAPVDLHMERQMPNVAPLGFAAVTLTVISVALILLSVWSKKFQREVSFGLVWFFAALIPVLGLFKINAGIADHWLYVPSMGFVFAASSALDVARGFSIGRDKVVLRSFLYIFIVVVAALLLGITTSKNRDWHDNESLFKNTLKYSPLATRPRYNLAIYYESKGKIKDAVTELLQCISINPDEVYAYHDLARIYENIGERDIAKKYYMLALNLTPNDPELNFNLGAFHQSRREFTMAKEFYLRVENIIKGLCDGRLENIKTLNPRSMEILSVTEANLAILYRAAGEYENAKGREVLANYVGNLLKSD